jgi:DNA-binding transcriptional MerR regulator
MVQFSTSTITYFTAGQASRLTGVAYATLDSWARTGFLRPSIADAAGKGSERHYSFADLVALRAARELRAQGISLQKLRRVVEYVSHRNGLELPLSQTFLITDGTDVYERQGNVAVSLLVHPEQLCLFVLDLGRTAEKVRLAVAA